MNPDPAPVPVIVDPPAPVDPERLRRLLAEATPGEWRTDEIACCVVTEETTIAMVQIGGADGSREDAALIVAMHEALPALLRVTEAALAFRDSVRWDLDGSAGDFVRREMELWAPVNEALDAALFGFRPGPVGKPE